MTIAQTQILCGLLPEESLQVVKGANYVRVITSLVLLSVRVSFCGIARDKGINPLPVSSLRLCDSVDRFLARVNLCLHDD